ncbi:MAG: PAS domain S-box protein [Gemmatimonadales bacterium]|nr:PAS domain S-box protein [Gemmatimonadales bacterium]
MRFKHPLVPYPEGESLTNSTTTDHLPARVAGVARLLAGLAAVWAAAILVAWRVGHWEWMALGSRYVPPAPGAAILLLLSAVVVLLRTRGPSADRRGALLAAGGLLFAVALGTAAASGSALPIEVWLTPTLDSLDGIPRGRTSLVTAALFAMLLLGLSTSALPSSWRRLLDVSLPLCVVVATLLLLQGYLLGGPLLYGNGIIPVAALTALGIFTVSTAAVLLAGPHRWPVRVLLIPTPGAQGRAPRRFWWLGLAMMLVVSSSSYFWARGETGRAIRRAEQSLLAVVDLKARELGQWHAGQLSTARAVATLPISLPVPRADRGRMAEPLALTRWMATLALENGFRTVALLDARGVPLIVTPSHPEDVIVLPAQLSSPGANSQGVHEDEASTPAGGTQLRFWVPLEGDSTASTTPTWLALVIDLEQAITPLLRDLPASPLEMRAVLWRRSGDRVSLLAAGQSGPSWDIPAAARDALAHSVSERALEGTDALGVRYIAAVSPVPGTTWEVAARFDREALQGPIRRIAVRATIISLLIVSGLVLGLIALGSRRDLAIASRELELIAERAAGIEELRQSEARYARAVRGTSDGLWDWDLATGALYLSPHWRDMLGVAPEAASTVQAAFFDRLHPDDVERVRSLLDAHLREGAPYSLELRLRHDDGEYRWFWTRGEVERDASGQPRRMAGAISDITARRTAEEALQRTDRILRMRSASNLALVRAASEEALHQDVCDVAVREGGYLMAWVGYAEHDAERSVRPIAISGNERGYLAAHPMSWGDNARGQGPTGRCIRSGEIQAAQDLLAEQGFAPWRDAAAERGYAASCSIPLKVNGVVVGALMLYSSEPHRFDPEELTLLTELGSDLSFGISAIRDHAAVLRQQDELLLFRQVMQRSNDAIFVTDATTGTFIDFNETSSRWLGYTAEELRRMRPADIVPEIDGLEGWRQVLAHVQREGHVVWARTYRRKDGTTFPVEVALTAITARGRSVILSIARDITEREQLTQQLFRSQKMESVGRLAGGIAHDFNNLLTVINATADFAITELPPDAPIRQDLAEIRSAGDRAAVLTRQLLAFSRQQVLRREAISLNDLVNGFLGMLRRVIGEDVRIDIVLDPVNPTVQADRGQLDQVLMNLAINARDAMPAGGTLTIATSHVVVDAEMATRKEGLSAGTYAVLQVSDTGIGMDAATQAMVFEPFFTTKEAGKGTGLGLSTVYGIVRQSGGAIDFESALGSGTTFRIYLPLSREETRPNGAVPASAPTSGSETILLVEDEEAIRQVAKRVLERAGYLVVEATNGVEALEVVRTRTTPIHLVMTDLVMPTMSGTELAARLAESHPGLRVLLTSGYSTEALGDDFALDAHVNFLGKPYTVKELLTEVRRVLDA